MTIAEAKEAWKSPFRPVKCDGVIYDHIKALEYHRDGTVYLQLYDADAHSITTVLPEHVRAVSTEEYFEHRARKKGQIS